MKVHVYPMCTCTCTVSAQYILYTCHFLLFYIHLFIHLYAQCTLYVYCDATYIGEVVDCNEGVCIPDPANGLTAHCLCPKNTSGQFCEMCKCRRRASGAVFDTMLWNV